MGRTILGLDIGGANLKAALSTGAARVRRFDCWTRHQKLAEELRALTRGWQFDQIAITMTAELSRCFKTKRQGVKFILGQVAVFANGTPSYTWSLDGAFHAIDALVDPATFAATNWLALATFVGRWVPRGRAVLIDVGSTTTDVIPLLDGWPIPTGRTDASRQQTLELVYTGVRATPVCALLGWNVLAETFATTHDAYLLLGKLPESPDDCDTADGRPATRRFAEMRLARMLGGDLETVPAAHILRLAQEVFEAQRRRISEAIQRHGPNATQIISGSGEFLARAACDVRLSVTSMAEQLGGDLSSAACAYAVALLAAEQLVAS